MKTICFLNKINTKNKMSKNKLKKIKIVFGFFKIKIFNLINFSFI